MVHTFEMKGKKIAYDIESCALLELDALAYAVLEQYIALEGQRPGAVVLERLSEQLGLPLSQVEACCGEFDQLIQEGVLFSAAKPVTQDQLYPTAPVIKAMCLHICHDCNLRCRYCFAETGDFGSGNRTMLDIETGKQAIDFLLAVSHGRKNLDIDFFGGEPLMNWPVVVALTEYCEARGKETGKNLRLTITTNGLLLDEEKIAFINRHMKNCVLSIDGRPEVNDHMRPTISGSGSYKVISERIKKFLVQRTADSSDNYEHYVRGTFTKHNLDFALDVAHLVEKLDAKHISVEPVVTEENADYGISMEDLPAIEGEYERLAEYLLARHKSGEPVEFFHFISDNLSGPCLYKRLKGCGVGSEYCAVTPEGDIYPCHQFVGKEEYRMGNVADIAALLDEDNNLKAGHRAEDILDPKVHGQFMERLLPRPSACQSCFARYHCGGGCPANNLQSTGSMDEVYLLGCALAKKRLECALWLEIAKQEV